MKNKDNTINFEKMLDELQKTIGSKVIEFQPVVASALEETTLFDVEDFETADEWFDINDYIEDDTHFSE